MTGKRVDISGVYVAGGKLTVGNLAVGPGAAVHVTASCPEAPGPPCEAPASPAQPAGPAATVGPTATADFYVSYARADADWARWISWELEAAGYRVHLQDWDAIAGSHRVYWIQEALRTAARVLVVLSEAYLVSATGTAEWSAAWAADPAGTRLTLLLVRVEDCAQPGLLADRVALDLFGQDAVTAGTRLRAAVAGRRAKPPEPPAFPSRGAAPFPWR